MNYRLLLFFAFVLLGETIGSPSSLGKSDQEKCVLQDLVHFTEYRFWQMNQMGIANFSSEHFKVDFCFGLTIEDVKKTCKTIRRPDKDFAQDQILLISWSDDADKCVTLTKDDLKTARKETDKVKFFFQTEDFDAKFKDEEEGSNIRLSYEIIVRHKDDPIVVKEKISDWQVSVTSKPPTEDFDYTSFSYYIQKVVQK